ncbi:hypothetical protein NPIL_536401 [Nephila pilipes]|uniref:Uncharacterized protein n=1 Tax=Nephila pilipes TaxID=299642 RepID=A0A8X6NRH3_NEPPI|nr:hypothetical protein NPIL_536401 [Nephila pilipes]
MEVFFTESVHLFSLKIQQLGIRASHAFTWIQIVISAPDDEIIILANRNSSTDDFTRAYQFDGMVITVRKGWKRENSAVFAKTRVSCIFFFEKIFFRQDF